jgi:hypothetical protein
VLRVVLRIVPRVVLRVVLRIVLLVVLGVVLLVVVLRVVLRVVLLVVLRVVPKMSVRRLRRVDVLVSRVRRRRGRKWVLIRRSASVSHQIDTLDVLLTVLEQPEWRSRSWSFRHTVRHAYHAA